MTASTSITIEGWTGRLGMGLAERELQCVLGIACGKTSKELARDLGVQPDSIKKRVLAASTKLGVIRRAQLVAAAISQGIIAIAMTATPDPQGHEDGDLKQGVLIA